MDRGTSRRSTASTPVSLGAVIFDFYGTLARSVHGYAGGYAAVFARFGYRLDSTTLARYQSRYDGIEHLVHSVDEASYEAWVAARLHRLVHSCGVAEHDVDRLVEALVAADAGELVVYRDVDATLSALRALGLRLAICSNWGWQLRRDLERLELFDRVDVVVTSAQAGYRKPHPMIYRRVLDELDLEAHEVLFVGDSHHADVEGPRKMGMHAVELWRGERGAANEHEIDHLRIESLSQLLGFFNAERELQAWAVRRAE